MDTMGTSEWVAEFWFCALALAMVMAFAMA